MQEDVGFEVVTDGEFRRGSYWAASSSGSMASASSLPFSSSETTAGSRSSSPRRTSAEKLRRTPAAGARRVRIPTRVTKATPKITLPSPSTMHFYRCTDFATATVYPTSNRSSPISASVFREEIADLAEAGCRYIQFDEVAIVHNCAIR